MGTLHGRRRRRRPLFPAARAWTCCSSTRATDRIAAEIGDDRLFRRRRRRLQGGEYGNDQLSVGNGVDVLFGTPETT
jgi:Ca2+-binding RTX toxin-like protein